MKEEIEFYLGYIRNPKDIITNGFQDIKETEVILYKDYGDYREVVTKEKILVIDKLQTFDGHKFLKEQAGFIGRIGNKLNNKEAIQYMTNIRKNKMVEYIDAIYQLLESTREKSEIDNEEYNLEEEKFKKGFRN